MSVINCERMMADLRELATIGRYGQGVQRLAFSEEDIAARQWLCDKFTDAGLTATIDNVGNVIGCSAGTSRALLIGSHTDTVPAGGWLDGSLGVIYGLEVARALLEAGALSDVGVDVVSFADEEGTFASWLGSRTFCGDTDETYLAEVRNQAGTTLREAIQPFTSNPRMRLEQKRYIGYLEAHIEQGPRLEALGKSIGIVTSIVGIRNHRVAFTGREDHAGTTPMHMRKDAGQRLIRFADRLLDRFEKAAGPETVWNIGRVDMQPGAQNVVPAHAELLLQYRDPSSHQLGVLDSVLGEEVRRENLKDTHLMLSTTMKTEPVKMDNGMRNAFRKAAEAEGISYEVMASGAGHDAAAVGRHLPTGMLFIPSTGGRSHTAEEDTPEPDIIAGARTLLRAAQISLSSLR